MSTGSIVGLGCGGLVVVLAILSAVGARAAGDGHSAVAPATPRTAEPKRVPVWVGELARALDGASPTRTDKSCVKFTCTSHATSIGEVQRLQDKKYPAARKLLVSKKIQVGEVGHSQSLFCHGEKMWEGLDAPRRYYLVDEGPLSGAVIVTDPDQTHILTPQYLLPTTEHGFHPDVRECVWKRLR